MRSDVPRVVVNLKAYAAASGDRAVALAKAALKLEKRYRLGVAVAPQALDVRACVATGARVYAQHADVGEADAATGSTRWERLVEAGVEGCILNHSEHRLKGADLAWLVQRVNASRRVSLVCAKNDSESAKLAMLRPTAMAVEPPKLIGGDVSVTTVDPSIVRRSVDAVQQKRRGMPVLCGAGVKDGRDMAAALALGAHGVLVASGVVKAASPAKALEDLVRAAARPS